LAPVGHIFAPGGHSIDPRWSHLWPSAVTALRPVVTACPSVVTALALGGRSFDPRWSQLRPLWSKLGPRRSQLLPLAGFEIIYFCGVVGRGIIINSPDDASLLSRNALFVRFEGLPARACSPIRPLSEAFSCVVFFWVVVVPISYLAIAQPRKRASDNQRGKKNMLSLALVRLCEMT
jgi:hypothetical protein